MKHISSFNTFLKDNINLPSCKLNLLKKRVTTITEIIDNHFKNYIKFSPQGSYALKTIIKPVQGNDEFDADILVLLESTSSDYTDYIKKLFNLFNRNGNYNNIKKNTRCLTIEYVRDFHVDIVPCIKIQNQLYICNSKEQKYETSDGELYKQWLVQKNSIVKDNNLRKTIKLLKYLRDHKDNFSVKSILLTTLVANQVTKGQSLGEDLPTVLKNLSEKVNIFLENNLLMPIIQNPVLQSEDFNRNWDQSKYSNFREKFKLYNKKIQEAFSSRIHNESIRKWREVFGETFGNLEEIKPKDIPGTKPYKKS